ncbi:MATE family efflux transporter [Porphyromonas sp.]|uniref:MATE family efflux transporter n=1 Tax=Porphyromonas sp. TaxID=1924944 RepID=UPI0026DCFDBC|nr:MATE family efflux transporter [Porphyromonas sp.]MDO4771647.1 MATE family efflux transporter [Porphyromonas sp.]
MTHRTDLNNSATYELAHAPIPKLLRSYAIPAVVATMVNSLYNIVDRMFIGHGVDSLAISGLAITFPILIFLQAFGLLIGVGAAARISILLGQKEPEKAENLLGNAFVLSILFSVSTIALCMIFLDPLLKSFGATDVTLPYAREYLRIALPGNIFANLCFAYNSVMRASGYPTKAMTTMIIGALINIVLDFVFIFIFDMGIRGAAAATVIAMFVGMCYVMAHFLRSDSLIKLKVKNFGLRKEYVIAIVSIGMAPFAVQFSSSFVSVVFNKVIYMHGDDYAMGAYGIQNSFGMLIVMLMLGVSQGMQPIVGFNYGAGRLDRMKEAFRLSSLANLIIGLVGVALALFIPDLIAKAFTDDPKMVDISANALRLVMWALWGVGFQMSATQFFQSIGHAKKSIFLSLSRYAFFLLPVLLILPNYIGLNGVWLSFPIADVGASILSGILIYRFMKRLPDSPAPEI